LGVKQTRHEPDNTTEYSAMFFINKAQSSTPALPIYIIGIVLKIWVASPSHYPYILCITPRTDTSHKGQTLQTS